MSSNNRILSVSYNNSLMRTRTMVLESGGYSVVEATNYERALNALASGKFCMMLLDDGIPSSDSQKLIAAAAESNALMFVGVLSSDEFRPFGSSVHKFDSHRPEELLNILSKLCRSPKAEAPATIH